MDGKQILIGIDLNLQFPAGWEEARQIKFSQRFTSPAPRDFVGDGPLVAPESLAVYNFTLSHNFELILAYHTQGKEIYWQFQNYATPRARAIGEQFANVSGYRLANVPFSSSFAGYKDWFLQEYRRPGYTIEAGIGQNPLPTSQFNEIYRDNLDEETIYHIYEYYKKILCIDFDFHIANGYYETNDYNLGNKLYFRGYCMDLLSTLHKKETQKQLRKLKKKITIQKK